MLACIMLVHYEAGAYWAEGIHHSIVTVGMTLADLLVNAQEAVDLYFEGNPSPPVVQFVYADYD